MKVAKSLTYSGQNDLKNQLQYIDSDFSTLFTCLTGRVRFGRGQDQDRGENLAGEFYQFTSHATPNTEFSVALKSGGQFNNVGGAVPVGRIILWQDKAGSLYQGPSTGTAWTSANVYFKSDVASVTFLVFLIK